MYIDDSVENKNIYLDMPFEEYIKRPEVSNSMLKTFSESAHLYNLKYIKKTYHELKTPSQELGSLFHAMILEPDKCKYSICKYSSTAIKGKKEREELKYENIYPITKDDLDVVMRMQDSCLANELVEIVLSKGYPECSLFGKHTDTAIPIRGRIDWRDPSRNMIADLKTSKCVDVSSQSKLKRDIFNYRWHVQEAIYRDLENQCGNYISHMIWIVVQSKPPYTCIASPLSSRALLVGEETYRKDMFRLKTCLDENLWPIYNLPLDHNFELGEGLDLPNWCYNSKIYDR